MHHVASTTEQDSNEESTAVVTNSTDLNDADVESQRAPPPSQSDAEIDGLTVNQSLHTLLTESGKGRVLETETLDELSVVELQQQVDALAQSQESTEQAGTVRLRLATLLSNQAQVYTNALQCSDELCAVMISDLSREHVSAALNELTRDEMLSNATSGGYLRIVEQEGTYYGVFVGVIDDGRTFGIR
ncbi:hypothetical protein [Pseudidiomarina homiensis]|uniref:Uncharacterized protein n=1 Tax=Pseudidiomarina homiensis TaxID=364198 RepID=A0A432XU84_9GAMM|nr:hypothetical protein [Pseudidiomarina homiensis]RUO52296.1 hypothetical protein CWI70_11240 [Pseudidiomarina homiensis]